MLVGGVGEVKLAFLAAKPVPTLIVVAALKIYIVEGYAFIHSQVHSYECVVPRLRATHGKAFR